MTKTPPGGQCGGEGESEEKDKWTGKDFKKERTIPRVVRGLTGLFRRNRRKHLVGGGETRSVLSDRWVDSVVIQKSFRQRVITWLKG